MPYYPHIVLKCPVRFQGEMACVLLTSGVEARLSREHLSLLEERWSTGRLFLNGNGRGQFYVRLKPGNHMVARIIISLGGGGDLVHRQVHYRDGNRLNLDPQNLFVGALGRNCGSEKTHQEAARRGWRLKNPRQKTSQKIPAPPSKRDDDAPSSPLPPKGRPGRGRGWGRGK